jgi:DMSO reductase anchor subunit
MREMGYRVGRKHAEKLRRLALVFAFGLPVLVLLLTHASRFEAMGALVATLSLAVGLVIERWLFFAEAEHVSMLYYGGAEAA